MCASHYFIAVPLEERVKEELALWQRNVKSLPYKQWTYKEDLHLTLKFLGPVGKNELDQLEEALQVLKQVAPFSLEIEGIHYFGKPVKPRVLFANTRKTDALAEVHKLTEQAAEKCGYPKEKRTFNPHITLAKKWNGDALTDEELARLIKQHENKRLQMTVEEAVIYEIHPQQNPKYKRKLTYPFQI